MEPRSSRIAALRFRNRRCTPIHADGSDENRRESACISGFIPLSIAVSGLTIETVSARVNPQSEFRNLQSSELVFEKVEECAHVRDYSNCLRGASIGEFGYDCGVDIDANGPDP